MSFGSGILNLSPILNDIRGWCAPGGIWTQIRNKTTKVSAYRRKSRSGPTGQSEKAHIGVRRLSAEYVNPGDLLVRQRRFVAHNPDVTRKRHFKVYPGENVGVSGRTTSLFALTYGRVKFTHDLSRDVRLVNVLPEPPDELLRSDLWRYRTEHVTSLQDNTSLVWRRAKCSFCFSRELPLLNPPLKPYPRPNFLSKFDLWDNPSYKDLFLNYKFPKSS